jgi:TRAP-type uncharacterized transport system substrate-binding protein
LNGGAPGREGLKIGSTVLLLVAIGFVVAYQFVGAPPPRELVLATGVEGGGYQAFGARYADALARSGIELRLLSTAGSIENFEALRSGKADVALVQGGTAPSDVAEFAKGIASVYYEPLWIFHQADLKVARLPDLENLRLHVGGEGSGTRAVAIDLLQANGIGPGDATLLDGSRDPADALLAGEADAIFLVTAPTSEVIGRLMNEEGRGVRLMDVERHLAYVRTHPYLEHVILAEGVLDFERNLPTREIDLVAPTAILLAREDLHPALIPLFIEAAAEVHGDGDLLVAPGTFPSPRNLDAPLSTAAGRYFQSGPSFLYRVFPFAVAATLDRLKILLLPMLTLLLPLFRMAPPVYRWRVRRKIYLVYIHLERIEGRFRRAPSEGAACLEQLNELERKDVETLGVPASYKEELHNLRMHLDRVRGRIAGTES